MISQQIYTALRNKGFIAAMASTGEVIVLTFKNRQITITEVADALDIDNEFCQRAGTSVIVYGVDA